MPKERFHIYLADQVLSSWAGGASPAAVSDCPAFHIGAVSPDIFYYDFPSFSLSPLGDALHSVLDRKGISIIGDWLQEEAERGEGSNGEMGFVAHSPNLSLSPSVYSWSLGFACHFLADAAWHPLIEELSESMDYCAAKKLSTIECHRLLESEIEALRLTGPRSLQYSGILKGLRKRDRLFEIATPYRRFLEFAGLRLSVPTEKRIVDCLLSQNFFLRLFANATLGKLRDHMLNLPIMRYLGSLVTPIRPVLPPLFARTFPEDRNPFSEYFMEEALRSLRTQLPALAKRLS